MENWKEDAQIYKSSNAVKEYLRKEKRQMLVQAVLAVLILVGFLIAIIVKLNA